MSAPLLHSLPIVTWAPVEDGLVVGSRRGEFVGFVESTADGSYVAFDSRAQPIGRYETLASAKASTGTVSPDPRTARRRRRAERALFAGATVTGAVAGMMVLAAGVLAPGW
ncbi:peptide ABC transporter permease [Microbacterium saccharophilum]|uniref:Peptide ABC transporter permease n=1 Tax=Microbacterium saccharophilum TaxID=1213358 RepID=A0A5C8I0W7_9MICO|nr:MULTISPECIES: hypothetical protein [Microbacterium]TXK11363.1 peptide ABC transporter permease [Microbacterium saccharophilum]GEP48821.1 hypothetical protein MSA03_23290 [Microbacterium saccharophilum]SFI17788.1 hypothetical protein SAMN04487751_0120 [Microbacterium saccharophilum]